MSVSSRMPRSASESMNAADVVVGVLEKRGVDFHLAREHGMQARFHLVPRRDVLGPLRELAVRWNDAERLLPREGLLAHLVPALVELALVLRDPVLRDVMRRVCGARREVHEERLVGCDRFLLVDVAD